MSDAPATPATQSPPTFWTTIVGRDEFWYLQLPNELTIGISFRWDDKLPLKIIHDITFYPDHPPLDLVLNSHGDTDPSVPFYVRHILWDVANVARGARLMGVRETIALHKTLATEGGAG